jgi:hypothetical protein
MCPLRQGGQLTLEAPMRTTQRTALAALLTLGLLLAVQAPAFAPYARAVFASEAFNFVEVCPNYVSFEVARYADHDQAAGYESPVDTTVTIQAVTPPPTTSTGAHDFVVNQPVRLRAFDPPLSIELPDEGIWEEFSHHGRAVLPWTHRLAPGTKVAVGAAESFQSPPASQPHILTVSTRCKTPKLVLASVCASPTAATLAWRVRNPNAFPVDYNAEVQGVRQLRLGTVPAKSTTTFTTDRVTGPNTVILYVGGQHVATAAACRQ